MDLALNNLQGLLNSELMHSYGRNLDNATDAVCVVQVHSKETVYEISFQAIILYHGFLCLVYTRCNS